jgi:hypothetical protein
MEKGEQRVIVVIPLVVDVEEVEQIRRSGGRRRCAR